MLFEKETEIGEKNFNIEYTTIYSVLPAASYYFVDLPTARYCPDFWKNLRKYVTYIFSQLIHLQKAVYFFVLKSIWLLLICGFTKQGGS